MAVPSWTLLTDALLHRSVRLRARPDEPVAGEVERRVGEARDAFLAALDGNSPFAELVRRAALGIDEAEVFAAICAVELEPARQQVAAGLGGDAAPQRLTLWTLGAMFGDEHVGPLAVAPDSRLASAALVEVSAAPAWSHRLVGPAARVSWFLVGDDSPDPLLPADLDVVLGAPDDVGGPGPGEVLFAVGPDPVRRLQAVAARLGATLLVCDAPSEPAVWEALVREATISRAALVIRVEETLPLDARQWIERTPHLAWAVSSPAELALASLPRRPWREVRAEDAHVAPEEIKLVVDDPTELGTHRLTAHQLRLVASAAAGVGGVGAAVRRLAAGPIEKLARRVRPRLGWDDLILPDDQLTRLHELSARYRHRGVVHGEWGVSEFPSPGVVALFAGAPGTGKTTAAEVLAADLGVDLFKIDLSSVVSKYVGETERNLEELFAAAQSGDLVLCFDEADALFGRRGEVSDAHDRYANIEVSYLLQRIETYSGFVVLTTNLQANIDEAFIRRLHARIDFPIPGPEERRRIWERSLLGVPVRGIDLAVVAERFDVVGGAIRGAALTAAFAAAERGTPVTAELLALGLKREYQKQGRLITPDLFGERFGLAQPM